MDIKDVAKPVVRSAVSGVVTENPVAPSPYIRRITPPRVLTFVGIAAVLYFAKDVILPLSIAVLITFALSPLVTRLRRLGVPQVLTVLVVVATTFVAVAIFSLILAMQVSQLAQGLPTFQRNIIAKVEALQESSREDGILSRMANMISAINAQIGEVVPSEPTPGTEQANAPPPRDPLPVEVVETTSPVQLLQDLVLPLVSPVATTGLVIVVVIFMLLEREELRDRFIRLLGSNDLHRTTQVLEEAGQRVGKYLLIQLLVNAIYAVPIALGLWLIGVPNALLWGLMTLILRFVPYIGSILAAAFPLFLAFAISPDWSAVLWTIALFGVVELITSNVIEPKLYGSRTGVSPLAIIIAAIFWTWIWGPLGLVLSTPLTVCLVVLGRHIPQFEVFYIILGDEPVLAPHARLYQRLLAGDALEATSRAEEAVDEVFLADYYRDVGIPALLIAQTDHARGVLTPEQETRLVAVAMTMIQNLQDVVTDEVQDAGTATEAPVEGDAPTTPSDTVALDGIGFRVTCIGGRSRLDDVAAAMLAQAMAAEGADVLHLPHTDLAPANFRDRADGSRDCVILAFLDAAPSRASLLHIRRIKRAAPAVRIGVVIWQMPPELHEDTDIARRVMPVSAEKLLEASEIGADFVVTDLEAAMAGAFTDAPAKAIPLPVKRKLRPQGRGRVTA